jgi:hypothetical protein
VNRITYLSVAESELTEATVRYNEEEPGLGRVFLDAISQAEKLIQEDPQRWAHSKKPVRSYRVRPFPYRIHYRELPDRIQIVAVAHLSRRPDYWKDR